MTTHNSRLNIKHRCARINTRIRTLSTDIHFSRNLRFFKYNIFIPAPWKVIILSPKLDVNKPFCLYLYSPIYFFKYPVRRWQNSIYFDKQLNTLVCQTYYGYRSHLTLLNAISSILYSFTRVLFKKIKFRGKGYYIYKNIRNTITPQFGHSHRRYVYSFYVSVKFLSKTKILLFGVSKKDLLSISYQVRALKPMNVFTGRGVRFSRQVIYRKTGKVSTYR